MSSSQALPWAKRHFDFPTLLGSDLLDSLHQEQGLLNYEKSQLVTILSDVGQYLHQVVDLLTKVEDEPLSWYQEERVLVTTLLKEVSLIELFMALAMAVPGVFEPQELLSVLKHTSDRSAKAKQAILQAQTAVSIAAQYHEIRFDNISEIHREVATCAELYESLVHIHLSLDLPGDLTMEKVIAQVKLTGSISENSINTPCIMAFSDDEKAFFENFEKFENRFKPISISIKFLEHRIGEFNQTCGIVFPSAIADVNNDYDSLRKAWKRVLSDFSKLRDSAIVLRWRLLCVFLIDRMLARLDQMTQQLNENQGKGILEVTDEFGTSFKLCSNANTLLHKAVIEHIGDDESIKEKFKTEILTRWKKVNELLDGSIFMTKSPGTPREGTPEIGEDGLKPVKMIQRRTPLALSDHKRSTSINSLNNGFDLRLDVNPSPNVPISAYKADRFVDLNVEPSQLRSTRLQMALLGLQLSPKEEDTRASHDDSTETLVHPKTPELRPGAGVTLNYSQKLQELNQAIPPPPSNIPVIVSNYIHLRLPVIKKLPSKGSRIPSISPTHPVFLSPERRPQSKQQNGTATNSLFKTPNMSPMLLRSPPLFTLPKKRVAGRRLSSAGSLLAGELTPHERSRASLLTMRADKLSLAGQTTPNLAYDAGGIDEIEPSLDRLSLRSTSPDRPGSSIGSRFDESHLVQPVKPVRKAWK